MPLTIACGKCGKKYQVGDQLAGKQVRCQGCGTVFVAAPPPAVSTAVAELDPLADLTLAALPAAPGSGFPNAALSSVNSLNPLGALPAKATGPATAWQTAGVSNPSGGPTDAAMRLGSVGMILVGCFLLAINFFLDRTQGAIYVAPMFLSPLAIIMGIAGVIDPNVVRAAGKYGGHLSWHYKAIGAGLVVVYLIVLVLMAMGLYSAGYFQV